jgi:hypothetical protein
MPRLIPLYHNTGPLLKYSLECGMVWFEAILIKVPKKVDQRFVKIAISLRKIACANIEQRMLCMSLNTTLEKYPCMHFKS